MPVGVLFGVFWAASWEFRVQVGGLGGPFEFPFGSSRGVGGPEATGKGSGRARVGPEGAGDRQWAQHGAKFTANLRQVGAKLGPTWAQL